MTSILSNNNLMQVLIQANPYPIAIFDNDIKYLMISDRWRTDFHLGDKNIIGQSHYSIFPDVPQYLRDIHQKCLAGESYKEDQVEYPRADGSIDYLKKEIHPWYTNDNEIGGIVIFAEIITKFVTAGQRLQEQLRFQTMMIQNLPDFAVFLFDTDLNFLMADGAALRHANYDPSLIKGKSLKEIVPPDSYEEVSAEYRKVIQGESVFFVRNTPTHIYHNYGNPIFDDMGELVAGLIVTQNVTQLNKIQQSLKITEARFEAIFNNTFQFIGFMNPDGILLAVNKTALDFAGVQEEDVIGQPFWETIWWSSSTDVQQTIRSAVEYAATGEFIRFEIQVMNKWGKLSTIDFSIKPLFDEQGNVTQLIPEGRDISDMVQIREALTKSNAELENFAYVASHDLQEPLRMVTSFLNLLKDEYQDELSEEADQYINYAVDGARRMKTLIQDLLAYSRITTQGDNFSQVDLDDVLQSARSNLSVMLDEYQVAINLKSPLPQIIGDQTQLVRVFQNLISNAVKFRQPEQQPIIDIDCQHTPHSWQISISDNGIGIDSKFYDRIFAIFQRLHRREDYAGTGIGLSICKKIIERHQGTIWVESQIGQGTTFYFTIPINENEKGE